MNWLAENWILLLVIGLGLAALLGFAWSQTGRRALAVAAAILALVTLVVALFASRHVTPKKAVIATISAVAKAIAHNDLPTVKTYLVEHQTQLHRDAEHYFGLVDFSEANVKPGMRVAISPGQPDRAQAEFNVVVVGKPRSGGGVEQRIPQIVVVDLVATPSGWKVDGYSHRDPIGPGAKPQLKP